MAKRSLAEELVSILPDCKGVTRVRNAPIGRGNGKKKVKIARHEKEVIFIVVEPDHPRRQIVAETTDVAATTWQIERYLAGQKVEFVNA
jgi:hypothetical protein